MSFAHAYDAVDTHVWGKLYDRRILQGEYFAKNVEMLDDVVYISKILLSNGTISMITAQLYYNYDRPGSMVYVTSHNKIPAGKELLRMAKELNEPRLLERAYKAFLSHLYSHWFENGASESRQACIRYLKVCRGLNRSVGLPWKKRIRYDVLSICPLLYRYYRLSKDRSLIQWEMQQRQRVRQ